MFVIEFGALNDGIDVVWPQAMRCDKLSSDFLLFVLSFCCGARCATRLRLRHRRRTCDKCAQFRTFIIIFLRRFLLLLLLSLKESGKKPHTNTVPRT